MQTGENRFDRLQMQWLRQLDKLRFASYRWRWGREPAIVQAELMYHVFWYLGRYRYALQSPPEDIQAGTSTYPDKIWVSWLQGEDQTPPIVKKCIASIRANSCGREVIVLTRENMAQYVQLPASVLENYDRGRVPNAHFSDLLRIALLAMHGGLWVDATVWMTETLPAYITEEPLFCFKAPIVAGPSPIKASSWLISARPNHPIIVKTRDLLYEYWRKERYLKHYFLFHLAFALACDANDETRRLWKQVPYHHNANAHILQFELFDPFDEKRYEEICRYSTIHKLTYKFRDPAATAIMGTFYDRIFNP
jgi:hypothetical protein